MAITTVSSHVVSVNAIQGTLIADNAITAVHIATNAVSGTLIADNAVTAVHIAQNSITVTQLADDCVESDKIADGVITTNHLNKAMISSQTEVTPVAGDFVLLGDTSDSNNLKKAPLTLLLNSNVDLSTKLNLSGGTMTGNIAHASDFTLDIAGTIILDADAGVVDFKDGGTHIGRFENASSDFKLESRVQDKDIVLVGNDAGTGVEALRLDMSEAGRAIFNAGADFGTTSSSTYAVQIQATTGGNALHLRGRNAAENAGWLAWTDYAGNVEAAMYATADNLIFANTTSYTERMRIDSSGKVIIGDTQSSAADDLLQIETPASGGGHGIQIRRNDSNGDQGIGRIMFGNNNDTDLATISSVTDGQADCARLVFSTQPTSGNSTERMRIDSGGTLFLGTTTPTTHSALRGIVFENGALLNDVTRAAGRSITLAQNASVDTGNTWAYLATDEASYYQQFNGNHYFATAPSGSAGADVTFDTKLQIHNSGCVGIGSSADRSIGTNIGTTVINGSVGGGLWLSGSDSSATTSLIYSFVNGSVGRLVINQGKGVGGGDIDFTFNESASPKVRFTTGHLHFGGHTSEATGSTGGITMSQDGSNRMNLICATTGTGSLELVEFRNPNGSVGDIKTSGSSTSYNTSSDYRLKENVQYTWDATTRLKQLKPARFNFKVDADTTLDGFLAHEVQDIVPEAVSGEKDGEKMQGIDQSKLVPLLVKTIQELEARIATLEG